VPRRVYLQCYLERCAKSPIGEPYAHRDSRRSLLIVLLEQWWHSGIGTRMNVILFGASGMVGQGVLRECLLDPGVEKVLSIGRSRTGQQHAKLREIVHTEIADLAPIEDQLTGYDACFFTLGVSSAGMKEADYRRITYDLTLSAARTLVRLNPEMTFIYISGAGTGGGSMWARVKGETENALLRLPFQSCVHVPAGLHPTFTRHQIENGAVSHPVRDSGSVQLSVSESFSKIRDHHRSARPRDDQSRPRWCAEKSARKSGH